MKLPLWIYKLLWIERYFVLIVDYLWWCGTPAITNLSYEEAYNIVRKNPYWNVYEDIMPHSF